ncbi:MAG: polyphosphate kinase 1 [Acidobacteriota bacterium]
MHEDFNSPDLYLNRELSWLEFNSRVLNEALDQKLPLLERVRFISIFANNLDEFFMIRVSGVRRQVDSLKLKAPPDGLSPTEQLTRLRDRLTGLLEQMDRCWNEELLPSLADNNIRIMPFTEVDNSGQEDLREYFSKEVYPILTPLAFDPGHPFPHISNLSINLAIIVKHPKSGEKFARLKVPDRLPRLIRLPFKGASPPESPATGENEIYEYVWLEEIIANNLEMLFPGLKVKAAYPFRVTRNADVEIVEDEAADLLQAIKGIVEQRHFGFAIRLEVDNRMPEDMLEILKENLGLNTCQVYRHNCPVGFSCLSQLSEIKKSALKYRPFSPAKPILLRNKQKIFQKLKKKNYLLYHPYDDFSTVVEFLRQAAVDPDVMAIKQTLYRVGPDSPVVNALKRARENGKQVSILIEIKARFDEQNNIEWARELEEAGVNVVYGVVGLKTHCKACLVIRREEDGLVRYVHLATGNYNPLTARVYTDLGYFTTDPEIASDVSSLFNSLTGYSGLNTYRRLLVAPDFLRKSIIGLIDRETEKHMKDGDGQLSFKMNSLVDQECIKALYRASRAGVKINLTVRGICCLRPGVPEISENITVTSIVGRFLEHARIYYFRNGGDEEILLGSADLMPRNLNRRVELLFPVIDPESREILKNDILDLQVRDNAKNWKLESTGEYKKITPGKGEKILDSQAYCLARKTKTC